MFIFSSFGTVIFLVLTLDQNRKSLPCDEGWVEFSSFINPIWDKAVSHIVGIVESLQQTLHRELRDATRGDLFLLLPHGRENRHGQLLYLLSERTLFGKNCFRVRPTFPNLHFICFCPSPSTILAVLLGNGWQAQIIQDYRVFSDFTINCK